MVLPPNPEPSQPSGPSDLPASYRNPWLTLGESVQAVLADTRLRTQELWRRNGEGDIWRPGWWPRDVAPLFWPLLLALVLTLLVALGMVGNLALQRSSMATPAVDQRAEPPFAAQTSAATPTRVDEPRPEFPPESEVDSEPLPSQPSTPQSTLEVPVEPALEPTVQLSVDPLAELLERPEAAGLLIRATPTPDQLTLVLQVSSAFEGLPVSSQQRNADLWQQWALDLGFDHLELRDSRSGLLGRDALVGSGMIVLSEPPRS